MLENLYQQGGHFCLDSSSSSTVFVKMLAILIALCLWEGSSRKSMETWKELDLLFLISVSVVVPYKENTNVLND